MKIRPANKHVSRLLVFAMLFSYGVIPVFAEVTKTLYPSEDTFVDSASNPHAFGTGAQLQTFNGPGTPVKSMITYIKFDLSSIPANTTLNSATLNVYARSCFAPTTATKLYIGSVKSSWSESNLVWSNKPAYTENFSNISLVGESSGYKQWSVKQLVDNWLSGRSANNGLSIYFGSDINAGCQLNSSESATDKPYLTVKYADPDFHISGLTVTNVSSSSAKISWTTNLKSDSYINYGVPNTQKAIRVKSEPVTEHEFNLTSLKPATRYEYKVTSKASTALTVASDTLYFTTKAVSNPVIPVITHLNINNVKTTEITRNSARISWETDKKANTNLSYGKTSSGTEREANESSYVNGHSMLLSDLIADTEYSFTLGGKTEDGIIASEYTGTFRTLGEEQAVNQDATSNDAKTSDVNSETEPINSEPELTGFEKSASAAFSSPLVMALLSPATFMLFPLIILVSFVVLIIKVLKGIFKNKEPNVTPLETPEPAQEVQEIKKKTKTTAKTQEINH